MKNKTYPWIICGACLLLMACAGGLVTTAFSVYLPFLREEFQLTNTQVSIISTVRSLTATIAMFFTTKFYHKFSLRMGTVFSCVMLCLSCVVFAMADSAALCYGAAVFMGISYAFGTMISISLIVKNWFVEKLSTALAVALLGSSVASAIFPSIFTALIVNKGLSFSFTFEAVMILIVALIMFIVIRDYPSQLNMVPYGSDSAQKDSVKKEKNENKKQLTQKMRISQIVMLMSAMLLVGLVTQPFSANVSVHLSTTGFSSATIAAAISVFGVTMAIGKIMFGIAADRFGAFKTNFFFMGIYVISCFAFGCLYTPSILIMGFAVALGGAGIMMGSLGTTVWCSDLTSKEDYEKYIRSSQIIYNVGSLVGLMMPGIIADYTGSYSLVYTIYGVILLVATILIQYLYICRRRKN